jgi:hypothetical protein
MTAKKAGAAEAGPYMKRERAEPGVIWRRDFMEIRSVESFLDYFESVRGRTLRVVKVIPPEKVEWSFREG